MKNTNRTIMKPLSDLNLLNRFLFAVAMEDRETLELVLRIIVGRNLKIFDTVQAEKELHKKISRIKANEEIGVRYMQAWEEKIYDRMDAKEEGQKELLMSQIEKKLQKGKSVEVIADELEQEISVIKELIEELEQEDSENQE